MQHRLHQLPWAYSIRSGLQAVCCLALYALCAGSALAQIHASTLPALVSNTAITNYDSSLSVFHPVLGKKGMVASEQRLASQVGVEILAKGGNAIDAAVGVGFALAVVLPNAGNLGGGGFMLVHTAKHGKPIALDFRETAPASATRDMYLDQNDKVITGKSIHSPHAVGVPGSVAGLVNAHKEYGTLALADIIAPAIALAENGFIVSEGLAEQFRLHRSHLGHWPGTREIFFKHKDATQTCALAQCPLEANDSLKKILRIRLLKLHNGAQRAFIPALLQKKS